ncbi:MAG: LysM peptidoglycan-binding domain-containing protein [Kineosporiaceae bacterium]|nr:LysM peptidoglycan-binding domain-containing protein [Aeromicrobium sp.]
MRLFKAVAAAAALLAVAIAPPVLLVFYVGNPIPDGLNLSAQLSDEALIKLISLVVWVLWAQTMWCVVAEVSSAVRSTNLTRVSGTFGIQQQFARAAIGAIIAASISMPILMQGAAVASPDLPRPAPAATYASAESKSVSPSAATSASVDATRSDRANTSVSTMTIEVRRGDSLWSIAEKHLGNGERWDDIAAVNEGHVMNDGSTFHGADIIRAGWHLSVPEEDGNQVTDTSGTVQGDYAVKPGDTMSGIALEQTGDATAWPDLYEASQKLKQPVPMTDPDLIYPGQLVDLPDHPMQEPASHQDAAAPSPDTASSDQRVDSPTAPEPTAPEPSLLSEQPAQPAEIRTEVGRAKVLAPQQEARSPQEISQVEVAAGETDNSQPSWVIAGLTGAGALLAGSMLLALRSRRAVQHRNRRPGRTIAATDPDSVLFEKSITVAGATTFTTVELVDSVLIRLAATLSKTNERMPALAAIEVTPAVLALHLRRTSNPPEAPWVISDDGLLWVLDRAVDLDDVGPHELDSPAPWPLLVTIGHDDSGSAWMLNAEDLTVTVTGDPAATSDFARFIAAEVACNPWSRHTAVDLFGIAEQIVPMSPDRIHTHLTASRAVQETVADAVRNIDRLADYEIDTPTARARQTDPDLWPSRLVITHEQQNDELAQLTKLVGRHQGSTATGVIILGGHGMGSVETRIDGDRTLTIPLVNLALTAVGLTPDEAHGCAALLGQANQTDDARIPDLPGEQPWQAMATTAGSLRDEYRISRASNTLEPSASLLEEPDDSYVAAAATTLDDLEALAPKVTGAVNARVVDADPDLDKDFAAWSAESTARPRLRLLGPVSARTSGAALTGRRPFYTELFAYLATRPYGATTEEVAAALNISAKRVRIDIHNLRRWFGTNPSTGHKYLPDARYSPSAHDRDTGAYEIPDALVDIDLFRRLRLRGETRGASGIEDLTRALTLVEGRPFDRLRPSGWGWLLEGDRMDHHLTCAIVDVAHVLVTQHLQEGNSDLARSAATIAVRAAPEEDTPRLDLAAVLRSQGALSESERILLDGVCERREGGDAPIDLPERSRQIIDSRSWRLHRTG